jgi:hypothetical protein
MMFVSFAVGECPMHPLAAKRCAQWRHWICNRGPIGLVSDKGHGSGVRFMLRSRKNVIWVLDWRFLSVLLSCILNFLQFR